MPSSDGEAGRGARSVAPVSWKLAARRAADQGLGDTSLWPFAAATFLLRGGLVVQLAPILAIPSATALATFINPTSFTRLPDRGTWSASP